MATPAPTGQIARALWYVAAGRVEVQEETLAPAAPGMARLRMLYSGISRGTERLVLAGRVPHSEIERMRAPFQQGEFPHPVKYGYCAVARVEEGHPDLLGRTVFCLHPHQDLFLAPEAALAKVPENVPPRRAVLAANMETALNGVWDSGAGPADRIVIVGAGLLGLLLGFIAAGLPGAEVVLGDIDPARDAVAEALGLHCVRPKSLPEDADIVFHTSTSTAGLATALACAGVEARVMEMSWYGSQVPHVPLGGAFHARRLSLVSSQVGMVAASRRPRWTHARRLAAALRMLADPRLDALVAEAIDFADASAALPIILQDGALGLAPVIRYPGAPA